MEHVQTFSAMIAALYQDMRKRAYYDELTDEEIKRFAALEETIDALGLKGDYYANDPQKT